MIDRNCVTCLDCLGEQNGFLICNTGEAGFDAIRCLQFFTLNDLLYISFYKNQT